MNDTSIFYSGVLGALKTKGFVSSQENDPACDQALVSVSEWAVKRGIDLSGNWVAAKFNGAQVAALQDYMDWLETWQGMPELITLSTISMTLDIALAGGSRISLSASAILNEADHMGRAYIELHDRLVSAYDTFRTKRQIAPVTSAASVGNGSSAGAAAEVLDVQDVVTEERNGKRYYRLCGGRWLKFGAAAWPEVFEQAGIDRSQFEVGRQPFPSGYKMEVELEYDKPKKVRRIIAKG